jgi:peptidoglycan/xylan/chitin deacetylase (PgdA/CDA1 family)
MMRWLAIVVMLCSVSAGATTHRKKVAAVRPERAKVAVRQEPAKFTRDPVLGNATRVHGPSVTGLVAFTFDDGPSPETTPIVLDALKRYDVPAVFFVVKRHFVGKQRDKARELVKRELAEGHLVESHSASHQRLGHATGKELDVEIDRSFEKLASETNQPVGMFRPPYGHLSPQGRQHLKRLGITEVEWSIDPRDWDEKDAHKLRKRVLASILKQNGGVVLLHDVKPGTAKILAGVLDDLEAENCRRLATQREPIWPVSIHYFLRDGDSPRAVPDEVAKRTEAYKLTLPLRCAIRANATATQIRP